MDSGHLDHYGTSYRGFPLVNLVETCRPQQPTPTHTEKYNKIHKNPITTQW